MQITKHQFSDNSFHYFVREDYAQKPEGVCYHWLWIGLDGSNVNYFVGSNSLMLNDAMKQIKASEISSQLMN